MSSQNKPFIPAAGATVAVLLASAAVFLLSWWSPVARAATPGALQQKIGAGESRISALSNAVGIADDRLRQLDSSIAQLQTEVARIQSNLDVQRAALARLRSQLNAATIKLAQLQAQERTAERVLSQQLVASYESAPPDIVSVVLESNGFSNLLERLSFARRIRDRNAQIVAAVKLAQRRVAAQVIRLGRLEVRQRAVAMRVLSERNRVYAAKVTLVDQQIAVARTRRTKAGQLASSRRHVASLRRRLAKLEAAQAAAAAQAAGTSSGGVALVGPSTHAGSDPIPGFTIGRDDMGVDATAAPGTGIYAPAASTLVQVLPNWYAGQPLLLFQFATQPSGAPSDYWYVGEEIDPVTTTIGTRFGAGDRVASFAASGTGIEIGWGSPTSDSRTLAGATDPAAASPPAGAPTSWGESFKEAFGIG